MSGRELERGFRPGRWLLGRGWWFLPLLLSASLSLPWIFGERWYSDAPYYQAIATQMARQGGAAWWFPMQGDIPYFNKPPLAFWIHGIFVHVGGNTNVAVHLPEGLTFVAMCVVIAWIVRRFHGSLAGIFAGCTLALTNDWIVRVGNFKLDMPHTLWIFMALACWIHACLPSSLHDRTIAAPASDRLRWYVLAGLCLGAALLTKPFYALAAPLFFVAWLGLTPLVSRRRIGLVFVSTGIAVLLVAPWYASMIGHYGQTFIKAHIHEQTVARAFGEMHDAQDWTWYVRLIAGWHLEQATGGVVKWVRFPEAIEPVKMWPIYIAALMGVVVLVVRWRAPIVRRGGLFAASWLVVWFVALSVFGGKRNYYLMILHPATAWLAALALTQALGDFGSIIKSADIARNPESIAERFRRGLAVAGVVGCMAILARAPFVIASQRKELRVSERMAFMDFVRSRHAAGEVVYDCGLSYRIASLTYIEAGFWPRVPSERTSFTPDSVPGGALMAYKSDMLERRAYGTFVDPRDTVVFRSEPEGQYLVYQRHIGAIPRDTPAPVSK